MARGRLKKYTSTYSTSKACYSGSIINNRFDLFSAVRTVHGLTVIVVPIGLLYIVHFVVQIDEYMDQITNASVRDEDVFDFGIQFKSSQLTIDTKCYPQWFTLIEWFTTTLTIIFWRRACRRPLFIGCCVADAYCCPCRYEQQQQTEPQKDFFSPQHWNMQVLCLGKRRFSTHKKRERVLVCPF